MKRLVSMLIATICAIGLGIAAGSVSPATAATGDWPVVQQGQTSSNVKAVQYLLTARGYSTGADGVFGAGTKASVVKFQKSRTLSADGVVGAATWPKLTSATVKYGVNGNDARAAQVLLNKYGYGLAVDGVFGNASRNATVAFQKKLGLTQDGIIGPQTWRSLASGAKAPGAVTPTPVPVTNCANVTGPVPSSDTTTVTVAGYTFRVHKCLSGNLKSLLTAANSAGHTLGGWGYRSYDEQVALRKKHCGTSEYAIYTMPSGSCNPPTARPGSSMHERGLALDFNSNGKSMNTSDFNWLKANASKYGLKNLPSEKWHWSTNGN